MDDKEKNKEGAYAQLTGFRRAIPIILLAFALFIAVCFLTKDGTGAFGRVISGFLLGVFSVGGYFIPVLIAIHAIFYPSDVLHKRVISRIIFSAILLVFISAMAHAISTIGQDPVFSIPDFYLNGQNNIGGGFIGGIIAFAIIKIIGHVGLIILAVAVIAVYIAYFFSGEKMKKIFNKALYAFVQFGASVEGKIKKNSAEKKAKKAIREEEKRRAEERKNAKRIEALMEKESELYDDDFFAADNGLKELNIPELGISESRNDEDIEKNPTLQEKVHPKSAVQDEEDYIRIELHPKKTITMDYGFDPNEVEYTLENDGRDFVAEEREPAKAEPKFRDFDDSAASVFTRDFDGYDFAANERLASKQSTMGPVRTEEKTVKEEPIDHIFTDDDIEKARRKADFEMKKAALAKQREEEEAKRQAEEAFEPVTVEFDINPDKAPKEEPAPEVKEEPVTVAQEVPASEPRFDKPLSTPLYQTPVYEEPVYQQPPMAEQIYDVPVATQPVYEPVVTEQPVYETPAMEQPVYEAPAMEQPVYETTVSEQPIYETTVNEPAYEEPIYETSVNDPAYEMPYSAPEVPYAPEPPHTEPAAIAEEPVKETTNEPEPVSASAAPEAEPIRDDSVEARYRRAAGYAGIISDYPRAEEAEKRASEAERRADEAEKRIADAERRAAEAEKRAAEKEREFVRYTPEPTPTPVYTTPIYTAPIYTAPAYVPPAYAEQKPIYTPPAPAVEERPVYTPPASAPTPAPTPAPAPAPITEEAKPAYTTAAVEEKPTYAPSVAEEKPAYETKAAEEKPISTPETFIFDEDEEDEGGEVFTGNVDEPVIDVAKIVESEDFNDESEENEGDGVFVYEDNEIPEDEQNPQILEYRKMFPCLDEEEEKEAPVYQSAPTLQDELDDVETEEEEEENDPYAFTYREQENEPIRLSETTSDEENEEEEDEPPFDFEPKTSRAGMPAPAPVAEEPKKEKPDYSNFKFPSIEILKKGQDEEDPSIADEIAEYGDKLIDALDQFDVRASIKSVDRGPRITRYEIVPARGVRVSRVISLFDDIALNLAAEGIRMEAPIPGKSAIGVEIPNKHPSTVFLRDLLESDEFKNEKSKTFACIGKDVTGNPVFGDMAKMPHILIAGATGMGKSVCINSILISILYKARPDEVKFIMIDPKTVEFTMYNGIPHLLVPVVTDAKQAAGALMWAIDEMNRRYELMAKHEVRKLDSYNDLVREKPELGEPLPKIIIVIDELNDLMQQVRKPVEGLITNITQKARAAGIHMIIGTQRPSVDVITGVIKANVPSRISCKVTALTDSRTILDQAGAEKLLDKGDMLYAPVGKPKPVRVQGAFVSDSEVEQIMKYLKSTVKGDIYDEEALAEMTRAAQKCNKGKDDDDIDDGGDGEEGASYLNDKQFLEAVELAVKSGKISTSLIQRKISIGYGKAAKFIDIMEDLGIVSEPNGQKPRDVLVTRDEWHEMLSRRSLDD